VTPDFPTRHLVTEAATGRRRVIVVTTRPLTIRLLDGTPLRRVERWIYEAADGRRFGAERDEAP
jgi:hypothetical protein